MQNNVIARQYLRQSLSVKSFMLWVCIGIAFGLFFYWAIDKVIGVFIAFLMIVIIVAWALRGRQIAQRLALLESWKIPQQYLDQLYNIFPQSTVLQRQWIVEGFKDYLALHILEKKHLAMPSYAVDQLWHILLANPLEYKNICQQILGRELRHIPYAEINIVLPLIQHETSQESLELNQQDAFIQTWKLSCFLHYFNPARTIYLPRLFAVDFILGIKNNAAMELKANLETYKKYTKENSDSGGGSSCSSCGGD